VQIRQKDLRSMVHPPATGRSPRLAARFQASNGMGADLSTALVIAEARATPNGWGSLARN
jgi:hypothetical protein